MKINRKLCVCTMGITLNKRWGWGKCWFDGTRIRVGAHKCHIGTPSSLVCSSDLFMKFLNFLYFISDHIRFHLNNTQHSQINKNPLLLWTSTTQFRKYKQRKKKILMMVHYILSLRANSSRIKATRYFTSRCSIINNWRWRS